MLSDLDISSNCSEVSELFDEVDCTDPCDWFLDEVRVNFYFLSNNNINISIGYGRRAHVRNP